MDYSNGKTIKIPIRVINGELQYLYGGDLSFINDGAIGDLIVSESEINDNRFVSVAQTEYKVQLFEKGTTLMVGLNRRNIPEDMMGDFTKLEIISYADYLFIEVVLLEPLNLIMRGSKIPTLDNVRCKIPSLGKKEATSLNTAYTSISTKYEPNRRSHSGNVFSLCFYKGKDNKGNDVWFPLKEKREAKVAEFEQNMFLDYRVYKLVNTDAINKNQFDKNEKKLLAAFLNEGSLNGEKIKSIFNSDEEKRNKSYVDAVYGLLKKGIIK